MAQIYQQITKGGGGGGEMRRRYQAYLTDRAPVSNFCYKRIPPTDYNLVEITYNGRNFCTNKDLSWNQQSNVTD